MRIAAALLLPVAFSSSGFSSSSIMTTPRLWQYQMNIVSLPNTASNSGIKVDWDTNGVLSGVTFDPAHSGTFGSTKDLQSFRMIVDDNTTSPATYDTTNVSASNNGFDFNFDFYKRRTTEMIYKNGAATTSFISTLYTEFINDSDILYLYPRLNFTSTSRLSDVKYELKFPLSYDTLYTNVVPGAPLPADPHAGWSNLVSNGSFESGTTGWTVNGDAKLTATTGGYTTYNGKNLVYIQGPVGSYLQNVYVSSSTPGRTYSVTARIKSQPGTGTRSVTMSIAGAGSHTTVVNDKTWTQVSASAFASGTGTGFNAVRILTATPGDVLYIDDVQLTSSHSFIPSDVTGSYTPTGTTISLTNVAGGGISGHDAVQATCTGTDFTNDFNNGYLLTGSIGAPVPGRTYVLTTHFKSTLPTGSDSKIEILGVADADATGATATWTPNNQGYETYVWKWVATTSSGFVQGRIHCRPNQPLLISQTEIDDYDYSTIDPGSGWSLAGGTGGAISASSTALYGNAAATLNAGSGGTANYAQSAAFGSSTVGKWYTASAWVKMFPGNTGGSAQISVNGSAWSTAATIPDEYTWVRISTQVQATNTAFNTVRIAGAAGNLFIVDGVQLEENSVSTPPSFFEELHDPNTVTVSGHNLLWGSYSASFEESGTAVKGWVTAGGCAVSNYSSDSLYGQQSLKLTNSTGSLSSSNYIQSRFNGETGRTYNISFYVKSLSGSPTVRVWVENPIIGTGGFSTNEQHAPVGTGGWKMLNYRYQVTDSGATSAAGGQTLKISTDSTGGVLIDGIMVTEDEGMVYEDSVNKNNCTILYDSTNHKGIALYAPFAGAEKRLWSVDRYKIEPRLNVKIAKTTDASNTILTYTIQTDPNDYTTDHTLDYNLFLKPFAETLTTGSVINNMYSFGYTANDAPSTFNQAVLTRFNPIESYSGFNYNYWTAMLMLQPQQTPLMGSAYRVDSYRDVGYGNISYLWKDELKRTVINTIDKARDARTGGTWTANGNLTGGTSTPSGFVSYKAGLGGNFEQRIVQSGRVKETYNSFFFGQHAEFAIHNFVQLVLNTPTMSLADKNALMTAADNSRNVFDPSGTFASTYNINAAQNGSFETDTSHWATRGTATITRTNAITPSQHGAWEALITGADTTSTNNVYCAFTPTFWYPAFADPNANAYTAYVYARAVSGSPTITLSFKGTGSASATLGTSGWTKVSLSLSNFNSANNELRINTSAGAQVYIDQVMIEQTASVHDSRFTDYYTETGKWFNYLPVFGENIQVFNAHTSMLNAAKEIKALADAVGDATKSAYWDQMVKDGLDGAYWWMCLQDGWAWHSARTNLDGTSGTEIDGLSYYLNGSSLHEYHEVIEGSLMNAYRTNTYLQSNFKTVLHDITLPHDLNHDRQASYTPSDQSPFSSEVTIVQYPEVFSDNAFLGTINTNYGRVQPAGRTRLGAKASLDPLSYYYLTTDQDIHTLDNKNTWYDLQISRDEIALENESTSSKTVMVKIYDKVAGDGHDLADLTAVTELVTNTGLTISSATGYKYVSVTVPAHSLRVVKITYN